MKVKMKAVGALAALGVLAGVGMATTPSEAPKNSETVEAWAPGTGGGTGGKKNPCSPGFRYDPVTISCVWGKW